AKANGADIRMVYSPTDALEIARQNPDREVVFFGLGFETTMPSTALTVLEAERDGIGNFSVFCNHITIVTGDTKVVQRGACDRLFLTTTGIGVIRAGVTLGAHRAQPGDAVLVNG